MHAGAQIVPKLRRRFDGVTALQRVKEFPFQTCLGLFFPKRAQDLLYKFTSVRKASSSCLGLKKLIQIVGQLDRQGTHTWDSTTRPICSQLPSGSL